MASAVACDKTPKSGSSGGSVEPALVQVPHPLEHAGQKSNASILVCCPQGSSKTFPNTKKPRSRSQLVGVRALTSASYWLFLVHTQQQQCGTGPVDEPHQLCVGPCDRRHFIQAAASGAVAPLPPGAACGIKRSCCITLTPHTDQLRTQNYHHHYQQRSFYPALILSSAA